MLMILLALLATNVQAIEVTGDEGTEKWFTCVSKMADYLGLAEVEYRVHLRGKLVVGAMEGYIATTQLENTTLLVINTGKIRNRPRNLYRILGHEMVHIKQTIEGVSLHKRGKYKHRTHEIEAFELEGFLANECKEK